MTWLGIGNTLAIRKRSLQYPMGKSKKATTQRVQRPVPANSVPVEWLIVIAGAMVIVIAGVMVYANSFEGPFLFDDIGHIEQNEQIRTLWPIWTHLAHRRPVVNLSLAVNYAVSGYEVWSYHAFNVSVHILAALTLFGVIRRTIRRGQFEAFAGYAPDWLAALIAVIWMVHPLASQSVNYLIQRGESLMGLFYLLTIYCVIRGVSSPRRSWWYSAAIMSCGLGMASKAVMVTAPVVVLIFDRVFLSPSFRQTFRQRWGLYVGLAATWGVLFACGIVRGVFKPETAGTVGFSYEGIAWNEYLMTQPGVLVHYLSLVLWPSRLCLDYDWSASLELGAVVPQASLVAVLLAGSIWAFIRRPWLGFLGMWFFLILSPTSSFIPIKDPIFEHRMYLPLAAAIVAVVIGVDRLFRWLLRRATSPVTVLRLARIGLVVIVVGALGWRTVERNKDYHTRVAMWESVVTQRPTNARAYCNLGVALSEEGGRLEEAVRACRRSVEVDPGYTSGHFRLGQILDKAGALSEAVPAFREAIRLDPNYTEAYYSLGNTQFNLGQLAAAAEQYRGALGVDPSYVSARVNLANTLRLMGRPDEAIEAYRQAVETDPRFADARFNLGVALAEQGALDEAVAAFRKTIDIDPNHAPAHRGLANALNAQGKVDEAITVYKKARRLAPDHPGAHFGLGNMLMDKGKYDEAIKSFQEVLRLRPDFVPAQEAINNAMEQKKRR